MKGPKRFIIVDDDHINNFICKTVISKIFSNSEIHLFDEPEIALEFILNEYIPDSNITTLLFLDINMTTMTGWDFLDKFQMFKEHIHQQFTIYILSSSIDVRDNEKAATHPFAAGFVVKPLLKETLKEICQCYE